MGLAERVNTLTHHYYDLSYINAHSTLVRNRIERSLLPKIDKTSRDVTPDVLFPDFKGIELTPKNLTDFLAYASSAIETTQGKKLRPNQLVAAIAGIEGNGEGGRILEVPTGEGKTYIAALMAAAFAMEDKGRVDVSSANDYLAMRDANEMGAFYEKFGLKVGVIVSNGKQYIYDSSHTNKGEFAHLVEVDERKESYGCDVVYGKGTEFGFDFLRDSNELDPDALRQANLNSKPRYKAVLDEADITLLNEATNPLIQSVDETITEVTINHKIFNIDDLYDFFARIVEAAPLHHMDGKTFVGNYRLEGQFVDLSPKLSKKDQRTNKKTSILPYPSALEWIEKVLQDKGLLSENQKLHESASAVELNQYLQQALQAKLVFHEGEEYILEDDTTKQADSGRPYRKVSLLNYSNFSGRRIEGSVFESGLQQAIEARERFLHPNDLIPFSSPTITQSSITQRGYFSMYPGGIVGLTATAADDAKELYETYGVDVVKIPPHIPSQREDFPEWVLFKTQEDYFRGIFQDILDVTNPNSESFGQPLLITFCRTRDAEDFAKFLDRLDLPPAVTERIHTLTARMTLEEEAQLIGQAGTPGQITIATIAERGSDIKLGGIDPTDLANIPLGGDDPDAAAPPTFLTEAEQAEGITMEELALKRGGLRIIYDVTTKRATEQQKGRAGRSGNPGFTVGYLYLEGALFSQAFPPDSLATLESTFTVNDKATGQPITYTQMHGPKIVSSIESARDQLEERARASRQHARELYDPPLTIAQSTWLSDRNTILLSTPDTFTAYLHTLVEDTSPKNVTGKIGEKLQKLLELTQQDTSLFTAFRSYVLLEFNRYWTQYLTKSQQLQHSLPNQQVPLMPLPRAVAEEYTHLFHEIQSKLARNIVAIVINAARNLE